MFRVERVGYKINIAHLAKEGRRLKKVTEN
jgi:hypothetical protein